VPRWAGPPPLLIAVTVLGILVAPAVSGAQAEPPAVERAVFSSGTPTATPAPSAEPTTSPTPSTPSPSASADPEPTTDPEPDATPDTETSSKPAKKKRTKTPIAPQKVGVVTLNQYREVGPTKGIRDARALTSRPGVSIIGWQEGYASGPVYQQLAKRGWATKRYVATKGMRELAVSWRRDQFALAGSAIHKLIDGVGQTKGRYPFGDRYALRVTLRNRATGQKLSVINTHLPQGVENLDQPGSWRTTKNARRAHRQLNRLVRIWKQAPDRWVVGTGDYNVDARAEARVGTKEGIRDTFAGTARSSYSLLGFGSVLPTHPFSKRYVDYVHVAQPAVANGRIEVTGQRTFSGLHSDHRPLLVWMKLS
jgi:hypothetical protein